MRLVFFSLLLVVIVWSIYFAVNFLMAKLIAKREAKNKAAEDSASLFKNALKDIAKSPRKRKNFFMVFGLGAIIYYVLTRKK